MDVDSTFITGEVVEMLAARAGSETLVAHITERAMRGEIDFAQSLHERVATLAGLPVAVFDDVLAEVELTPGAAELVAELQARDWPVGLVSGGFVEVARPLAARLGITRVHANRLEVRDGHLTGRVDGPVVDRAAKAATLTAWAAERLGLPRPPEVDWTDPEVSEAMRRFYLDSKRVSNARAKAELGWRPRYPSYREGLEAILAEKAS